MSVGCNFTSVVAQGSNIWHLVGDGIRTYGVDCDGPGSPCVKYFVMYQGIGKMLLLENIS